MPPLRTQDVKPRVAPYPRHAPEPIKKRRLTAEQVKKALLRFAGLPSPLPPLLSNAHTSALPVVGIPGEVSKPVPPRADAAATSKAQAVGTPVKREPSALPTSAALKRKREEDIGAAPESVKPKDDTLEPPVKRPRVVEGHLIPPAKTIVAVQPRNSDASATAGGPSATGWSSSSPTLTSDTPDSVVKIEELAKSDEVHPKTQTHSEYISWSNNREDKDMIGTPRDLDRLRKNNEYLARQLSQDSDNLDALPLPAPQNTALLSLLQRTDSLLYSMACTWFEDELLQKTRDVLKIVPQDMVTPKDRLTHDMTERLRHSRGREPRNWVHVRERMERVGKLWDAFAAGRRGNNDQMDHLLDATLALLNVARAIIAHRTAEAHRRFSTRLSMIELLREIPTLPAVPAPWIIEKVPHINADAGIFRSALAIAFHGEEAASAWSKGRAILMEPTFLSRNFPDTWANCTRARPEPPAPLEEGETLSQDEYDARVSACDPWAAEPFCSFNVPPEPPDWRKPEVFAFQFPFDLSTPVSHFVSFARCMLYEIGRKEMPEEGGYLGWKAMKKRRPA